MSSEKKSSLSEQIGLNALLLITFVVTPGLTFDPINVPKFFVLGISAAALIFSIRNVDLKSGFSHLSIPLILVAVFVISMFISAIGSESNLSNTMFGSPGRQTGVLTYIFLSVFYILFASLASQMFARKVYRLFIFSGLTLSLYGMFQNFGMEILSYGNSYGSSVFGTFGNSNFLSAFLGMTGGVSALATLIDKNLKNRILYFSSSTFALLTIYLSNSQQGFLVFVATISFGLVLNFIGMRKHLAAIASFSVLVVFGFFVMVAFVNRGPLSSIIYQSSLSTRREYWFAAIQMLKSHLAFGVGFDNFGSYYRMSRSSEMARQNSEIVTDSAHNVFLDLASGGGLVMLIVYAFFIGYTGMMVYRVVLVQKSQDFGFIVLSSAWFGYLIQSLISINNIGLAIWGWAFSGLIIGYGLRSGGKMTNSSKRSDSPTEQVTLGRRKKAVFFTLIPILLGVLATPTFINSVIFYSSLKSGNVASIKNSAYLFPDDSYRYNYVATALRDNKFEADAIEVLRIGTRKFPDSFELWRIWSTVSTATPTQIADAKAQMKRLDPHNPNL